MSVSARLTKEIAQGRGICPILSLTLAIDCYLFQVIIFRFVPAFLSRLKNTSPNTNWNKLQLGIKKTPRACEHTTKMKILTTGKCTHSARSTDMNLKTIYVHIAPTVCLVSQLASICKVAFPIILFFLIMSCGHFFFIYHIQSHLFRQKNLNMEVTFTIH